ncbi:hypothetical protein SAMN05443667_10713 [Flavobacterium gillisiae]|uniref:Uncharacterized protein n=1 Tax=Flavobacterium gillisiae TaxID=150146 RepID=A0A1H4D1N3_9FLAO|nr:hypothetical protein SAMN05443667_10713 [Flavobacterium gillisiae]
MKPNFKDFIYVNFNLRENSSLKFNGSDTLYLQKRFPEEAVGNFIAVLNRQDKDSLIEKINKLNFKKYEPTYIQKYIEDGNSQIFIINRNEKTESIYIHGSTPPSKINALGNWVENLQSRLQFVKTDEYIHFSNIENIVTPPPPPPIVK